MPFSGSPGSPALLVAAACGGALGAAAAWRAAASKHTRRAAAVLPYVAAPKKRVLLISNSTLFGLSYLEHVVDHIRAFLGSAPLNSYVLFVPYALKDQDGYATKVITKFAELGYKVRSIHTFAPADREQAVMDASALFVGGGNTFRLLDQLYKDGVMPLVKQRVEDGSLKYIGSSAGTNVACPTIRNTNDMPIVSPPSLAGMCLIPFQINTHYIDKAREVAHHMGETRETRLTEFTEENSMPVLALREGSSVLVNGQSATLLGPAARSAEVTWQGARLFKQGVQPLEIEPRACLDKLMGLEPEKLFDNTPGARRKDEVMSLKSG